MNKTYKSNLEGDNSELTELHFEAAFVERVSRLFIFRFLWAYVLMFIMFPWAIWIGIVGFIQFLSMLFLGRRSEGLWKRQLRFMRWITKWQAYLQGLVDRRPKLIED